MEKRKFALFLIFFSLCEFSLFSLSFRSSKGDFSWVLNSTKGKQTLVTRENGIDFEQTYYFDTSGLIFYSYYKSRLVSSATLDMGFLKRPFFLWTNSPNFIDKNDNLNEFLRCVQFDYKFYIPQFDYYYFDNLFPFCGFSFVNLSKEKYYEDSLFNYLSFSAGIEFYQKVNRFFSHTYYISYAPMVMVKQLEYKQSIHYINYGAELIFEFRPINFNLFFIVRKIYEEFSQIFFFYDNNFQLNTTEIGFSFKFQLL